MRAKPCEGEFLPNGDFRTKTGRYIQGPLCVKCDRHPERNEQRQLL